MNWLEHNVENCPISGAMDIFGDRWTILVLREAANRVRRFDDFRSHLEISRPTLSDRLKKLVEHGIMTRRPYKETGRRERIEYHLTAKGWDLIPVLAAIREWGDRHINPLGEHPTEFIERATNETVSLRFTRDSDGEIVPTNALDVRPGPGALAPKYDIGPDETDAEG